VGRVVLLVTSPRLPAGIMTAVAWDLVRAHPVFAAAESDTVAAIRAAGCQVTIGPATADELLALDTAIWLAGPTGDPELAREIGLRLTREPSRGVLELLYGSYDPIGARLLDAVAVMDRLVSPGGDPWKREQTHQTLARYLIEEAYEAYDAIEAHDLEALREELGDVLLQVVLHARMAEEADPPWSIDDLAGGLVDKLVRRNPHVFGSTEVSSIDEITENWERIKQAEKSRESTMEGIAQSQPALALAAKILSRARRGGLSVPVPPAPAVSGLAAMETDAELGAALLAIVAQADAHGLDPEAALRRAALEYARAVRAAEAV
jgi:XTP/dITP diphosphohydrolase